MSISPVGAFEYSGMDTLANAAVNDAIDEDVMTEPYVQFYLKEGVEHVLIESPHAKFTRIDTLAVDYKDRFKRAYDNFVNGRVNGTPLEDQEWATPQILAGCQAYGITTLELLVQAPEFQLTGDGMRAARDKARTILAMRANDRATGAETTALKGMLEKQERIIEEQAKELDEQKEINTKQANALDKVLGRLEALEAAATAPDEDAGLEKPKVKRNK